MACAITYGSHNKKNVVVLVSVKLAADNSLAVGVGVGVACIVVIVIVIAAIICCRVVKHYRYV